MSINNFVCRKAVLVSAPLFILAMIMGLIILYTSDPLGFKSRIMKQRGFQRLSDWQNYVIDKYEKSGKGFKGEKRLQANREIIADFVGDCLFGGNNKATENLLNGLKAEPRNKLIAAIKNFFTRLKEIFTGTKKLAEIEYLENEFLKVANKVAKMNTKNKESVDLDGEKSYSVYDEYATNIMIWANSASTKNGDTKIFKTRKGFVLLESTGNGEYVVLEQGNYKEVKELEQQYREPNNSVYVYTEIVRNAKRRNTTNYSVVENNNQHEQGSRQVGAEKLSIVGTRNDEYLRSSDKREQKLKLSLPETDSQGNTLTENQREFFNDTKSVDDNGNLMIMYQGSQEEFYEFDRKKSSPFNLYGRGFYFTNSKTHANQYGNVTRQYYLNIKNPISTYEGDSVITKEQLKKYLEVVVENEDYSFENYGYNATVDSVVDSLYGKSDFAMIQDINATAIGDLVEAIELFNQVNGTSYDGIILNTETIIFNSNQAKLTTNENPSKSNDIRYSFPENPTAVQIGEAYKNGEIGTEEFERLINQLSGKNKVLSPTEIANLPKEAADTTPKLEGAKREGTGDGESKFYESLLESDIITDELNKEIEDDTFIKNYGTTNKRTLKLAMEELAEGGKQRVTEFKNIGPYLEKT